MLNISFSTYEISLAHHTSSLMSWFNGSQSQGLWSPSWESWSRTLEVPSRLEGPQESSLHITHGVDPFQLQGAHYMVPRLLMCRELGQAQEWKELSLHPPLHFNQDVGSFLPQAMKVLSKKKLIRQAGFPREFVGPGPLFLGAEAGARHGRLTKWCPLQSVPWVDSPKTVLGLQLRFFKIHFLVKTFMKGI